MLPVVAVDPVDPVAGKRDRVADAGPRHRGVPECRDVARAGRAARLDMRRAAAKIGAALW